MKILIFCLLIVSYTVQGAVQTQKISYSDEETQLNGYLFWDDKIKGKRPAIMVIHEWWGLNDYAKKTCLYVSSNGIYGFCC